MVVDTPTFGFRFSSANPASLSARELIITLSAIESITSKAANTMYGSDDTIEFRISHVRPGSIDIRGFIELTAVANSVFPAFPSLTLGIGSVPELIKAWLDLLKLLQGKPPQKVQTVSNGNAVEIQNASGHTQIVNGNVYQTLIFNNIGSDAAKLQTPLKRGAKALALVDNGKTLATYSTRDVSSFKSIRPEDGGLESEVEALLEVVAPVLEGSGAWRFRYGRTSLTAKLEDEEYKQQVANRHESFRRGDHLRVRLKTVQERTAGKIVTRHSITRVLDHPRE